MRSYFLLKSSILIHDLEFEIQLFSFQTKSVSRVKLDSIKGLTNKQKFFNKTDWECGVTSGTLSPYCFRGESGALLWPRARTSVVVCSTVREEAKYRTHFMKLDQTADLFPFLLTDHFHKAEVYGLFRFYTRFTRH